MSEGAWTTTATFLERYSFRVTPNWFTMRGCAQETCPPVWRERPARGLTAAGSPPGRGVRSP